MILERYLIREVALPVAAICIALLVIFTTFSLSRYLVSAETGMLQVAEVAQLTFLKALISLDVLLPLSLYLGLMTGLGRLYTDSEIYAMRAGGVSELGLLRPVLIFALVMSLIILLFSAWIRPWAYAKTYSIKAEAAATAAAGRIKAARFYTFNEGKRTVFIDKIDAKGSQLEGVFVRTRKASGLQVITARTGVFNYLEKPLLHRLELQDVRILKKSGDGKNLQASLGSIDLWLSTEQVKEPGYRAKSTDIRQLWQSTDPVDQAEFQWRLSTPLSTLLLAFLAIPLSRSRPRQGRYAKLMLALAVYGIYFFFLDITRSWVEQGSAKTIWWVPVGMALLVALFYLPLDRLRRQYFHAAN